MPFANCRLQIVRAATLYFFFCYFYLFFLEAATPKVYWMAFFIVFIFSFFSENRLGALYSSLILINKKKLKKIKNHELKLRFSRRLMVTEVFVGFFIWSLICDPSAYFMWTVKIKANLGKNIIFRLKIYNFWALKINLFLPLK